MPYALRQIARRRAPVIPIRRGVRGLGDCIDDGNGGCLADPGSSTSILPLPYTTITPGSTTGSTTPLNNVTSAATCAGFGLSYSNGNCVSSPATPASSTGSFNWDQTISNLLSAWTNIGGKVIAPTTTVTGAGGTVISIPGSQPGVLGSSLTTSLSSISSSTWILLGLAGVAAFLVIGMANKR
jgi:hypothetical protein